jgi:steroid delta-isomerase-like uncharacterized protein
MSASPRSEAEALTRLYYETFNSGDREAMLALLTADVVHDINQSGSEVGRDTFRAFLSRMDRCYSERVEELVVMADESGTRAAAEFYIRGTYQVTDDGLPEASGQEYWLRVGAFFELREGKVARVTNYYNLQDWTQQVVG